MPRSRLDRSGLFQFYGLNWRVGGVFGLFAVEDFPEDEAVGGGAHAGGGAVGLGEHGFDFAGGEFAGADLDEGADNAAAHFVEEAFALDVEGEVVAGFFEVAAGEGADGILDLVAVVGG